MIFIFGGYYQGKRDFAKEQFLIEDGEIFEIKEDMSEELCEHILSTDKKCLYAVENLVKYFVYHKRAEEVYDVLKKLDLQNKILIMNDMTQGIVPIDKKERKLREECGRLARKIVGEADEVYRIFAGLSHKLK